MQKNCKLAYSLCANCNVTQETMNESKNQKLGTASKQKN